MKWKPKSKVPKKKGWVLLCFEGFSKPYSIAMFNGSSFLDPNDGLPYDSDLIKEWCRIK